MAKIRLQGEEEKNKNIYFEVDSTDPVIGEGGMGKVRRGKCVDVATGISRPVAIKFLFEDLPPHAIERARREAAIQLRNDNLIEMLGFVETETGSGDNMQKHYHVVSELLHGVSLLDILEGRCADKNGQEIPFARKLMQDYQNDSPHFARTIVKNVLSGLVALHDAGYVHRDIDPSNIMVTEEGHIKLIDFGISKQVNKLTTNDRGLTTAGIFMGKAEYAAPELALGDLKHQNQTTDIYAMGILLYQCIVGHVPFEGPSHEVLEKQIKKNIKLSVIKDRGIRKIIACATNKNQGVRYQSASQMRVAMENLEGQKMKMKKSSKITIAVLVVIAVLAVAGFVVFSQYQKQQNAKRLLQAEQATNDSLLDEVSKFKFEAETSFDNGKKHGEGYEQNYIAAYNTIAKAIETSNKMTKPNPELSSLTDLQNSVRDSLKSAKKELQNTAEEFAIEEDSISAEEFLQRVNNITNILSK